MTEKKQRIPERLSLQKAAVPALVAILLGLSGLPVCAQTQVHETISATEQAHADETATEAVTDSVLPPGTKPWRLDFTVSDALRRVAGVQSGPQGQVNLRGTGFNRYSVSVNGQQLGSTGFGTRSTDLSGLSVDVLQRIEWIRITRPDMTAEGLAGRINLITDDHRISGRSLSAHAGGGANPSYNRITGPMSRASVQYTEALRDDFQLSVSAGYQNEFRGMEGLNTQYGVADFGNGGVDVMDLISPYVQTDGRERTAGSLNLRFFPDETQRYYLRAIISNENRELVQHNNRWMSNGNWTDENTTGFQGRYGYNLNTNDLSTTHYSVSAGGSNDFNLILLEYGLGWSYARVSGSEIDFNFHALNRPFTVNMDDRLRPEADTVNEFPLMRDMRLQPMEYIQNRHTDNRLSASVDLTVPFNTGYFKFGGKSDFTNKDVNEAGEFSHYIYTSRTLQSLTDFDENRVRSLDVLDNDYRLPWLADPRQAREFFISSIPNFASNEQVNRRLSDIWNHAAAEDIYAGYVMANMQFGNLTVLGGVRIEHTEAEYTGRAVTFDRFDRYESTEETNRNASSTMFFPNVQFAYDISSQTSATLSYSMTYHRQDYNILAPFVFTLGQDTTRFRGNPDLKPLTSGNFDFRIDHAISASGQIYAGAFFKMIENFTELRQSGVTYSEGDVRVFDYIFEENPDLATIQATETQFVNSGNESEIYGAELGVYQRLTFLPSFLRHFAVDASYAYSISNLDAGRDERVDMPFHSPHMLNLSLQYTGQRFLMNIAWQWAAESVTRLQDETIAAPSIGSNIYFDQYQDGWSDLSVSAGLRLTPNFTLWVNAYNLLGTEQIIYNSDRSLYPSGTSRRIDRGIMAGLQFDL